MVKSLTNSFAGRPTPLGTLLAAAGRRLAHELDAGLAAAGFADVRATHAPLFTAIGAEGSSVTELAARAHMTKQAMGELVRYLEQRDYVDITVNPADRRARLVRLTDRGREVLAAGERVVDTFDGWLESQVGATQVVRLRGTLERIIASDAADWGTPAELSE